MLPVAEVFMVRTQASSLYIIWTLSFFTVVPNKAVRSAFSGLLRFAISNITLPRRVAEANASGSPLQ